MQLWSELALRSLVNVQRIKKTYSQKQINTYLGTANNRVLDDKAPGLEAPAIKIFPPAMLFMDNFEIGSQNKWYHLIEHEKHKIDIYRLWKHGLQSDRGTNFKWS